MIKGQFRERFYLPLLILVLISILVAATFSLLVNAQETETIAKEFLLRTSNAINNKVELFLSPVVNATGFVDDYFAMRPEMIYDELQLEEVALKILSRFPSLVSFNVGYENGNFFMVKREADGTYATKMIHKNSKTPEVMWRYRDDALQVIGEVVLPLDTYDPRVRPWYTGAKETQALFWSDIYIFYTDQVEGITVGQPFYDGDTFLGVFSFDLKLNDISDYIKKLEISENGEAIIVNYKNNLIAFRTSDTSYDEEKYSIQPLDIRQINDDVIKKSYEINSENSTAKNVESFKIKGKKYYSIYSRLSHVDQNTWKIGVIIPENDFVAGFKLTGYITLYTIFVIILLTILLNYYRYSEKNIRAQLIKHSERDALTDLLNRRSITKVYDVLMHKKEIIFPMALIVCDIDFFKVINDTYGHNYGDYVLKEIAKMFNHRLRDTDYICRWGGEEFLLLLPATNEANGVIIANALRINLESYLFNFDGQISHVTMSCGVSEILKKEPLTDCVKRSDDCLYHAKQTGRNKVVYHSEMK